MRGKRSGSLAGGQTEKQEVSKQAGEMRQWQVDGMAGWRLQSLSLSQQGLEELPEMQVDPISGSQHNSWSGIRDPGGIRCQLKAEQGQGHSHLHLIHGKLLSDTVPGPERKRE